ncbi:hypothetical protein F5I97DRAFT_1935173 [Phlebopus sp. FC_14]|nr:hypothetical protein F5I97DRAFT_1935173 [Phlebopus sp. FC_14]
MSHYTTATSSFVLNKYSRSHPSPASLQSQPSCEAASEWQHFTNPVMRLLLDAKKEPSAKLVSMRLRILWNIDASGNGMDTDQREVVFEDLELLSFSSLPTFRSQTTQPDQGLPLKAVYRDAVVGIRYLHPKTVLPGCQPAYRRFQITFSSPSGASQFIDAIRPICPCKANPQSNQINRDPTTLPTTLTRAATTVPGSLPCDANVAPRSSSATPAHLPSADSSFKTCAETSHELDVPPNKRRTNNSVHSSDSSRGSLPSSSQPSSSNHSSVMPPPPVPRNGQGPVHTPHQNSTRSGNADASRLQLLGSLAEAPCLYNLSRPELEALVGRVVREEGFARLLDSLDSLWQIKGFLAR